MKESQREAVDKVANQIESLKSDIEPIAESLRTEHDALSEKARESQRAQDLESDATALEESLDLFDDLAAKLREI